MGRRGYPPEFRRKVLDLLDAGRSVVEVARDLGISTQSIYTWRRQDRIDRGLAPGQTSVEKAELFAARTYWMREAVLAHFASLTPASARPSPATATAPPQHTRRTRETAPDLEAAEVVELAALPTTRGPAR